ncbi:uncharacterized protein LOC109714634 [Ananas comosus]|uniref:Uncharacterized protein LOC109714634 n=1 Tax=Ananas comosus TaxID=4615 RepID=A0A6P5FN59_ANACO|nr:uncharacterized protein LOC109714634 [Ananas comosus]
MEIGSAQLINQLADVTAAEVTFCNGHRVTTIITSTAGFVAGWINEVIQSHMPPASANGRVVVGLHVRHYRSDAIAILQLCVGNQCLIYQLMHRRDAGPPDRLYEFLDDDRFCFTGVAVERAVNMLRMQFGHTVRVWADLGDAASRRRADLRWAGLDQLAREVMGVVIMRTNEVRWSSLLVPVLPMEHVPLACVDSVFSYELGMILLSSPSIS